MELALVVAVVHGFALEVAETNLRELGVRGITVTKVKGYGEHADFYARDWLVDEVQDRGLCRARSGRTYCTCHSGCRTYGRAG